METCPKWKLSGKKFPFWWKKNFWKILRKTQQKQHSFILDPKNLKKKKIKTLFFKSRRTFKNPRFWRRLERSIYGKTCFRPYPNRFYRSYSSRNSYVFPDLRPHAYVSPAMPPVVHCVYVLSDELGLIACSRVHFGITLLVGLGGG